MPSITPRRPTANDKRTTCDANDLLGAWWGEDGQIVAALDLSGVLWRIPADGGTPAVALDLRAANRVPLWPQVLQDGRLIDSASAPE